MSRETAEKNEIAPDSDYLIRALYADDTIKIAIARTTEIARTLRARHDAGPLGIMALSRGATGAILLASGLKNRQQLGVQVNGDGPIGELYAIADPDGKVRATIGYPRIDMSPVGGRLRLGPAFGAGRLTVVTRLEEDAPAQRGVVELVSGELGDDLAHYLTQSAQIPSAVALGERLDATGIVAAGGFLIQAMPGAEPDELDRVIDRVRTLPPIGELFADGETPETVLERLFDDARILARTALSHVCPCERHLFARRLVALGEKQLRELAGEHEVTKVECHFCREVYTFDREQMSALIYGARLRKPAD